ncbi:MULTISPECIES: hypothetical protein [Actinoplanes]|uniref:hypothetical protein n=1 Tax=Actinoplanes TaxID=1865 RepID=UPI0005F2B04E|nr:MULTISPECIES: hypothetical protein [Actinoplanes]GLY02568.1 hypothetical protein Acsp01_29470 [Actinoplanes sp. NBRC 101535]
MKRIVCVAFAAAAVLAVPTAAQAEVSHARTSGVVHLNCHGDVAPASSDTTGAAVHAARAL